MKLLFCPWNIFLKNTSLFTHLPSTFYQTITICIYFKLRTQIQLKFNMHTLVTLCIFFLKDIFCGVKFTELFSYFSSIQLFANRIFYFSFISVKIASYWFSEISWFSAFCFNKKRSCTLFKKQFIIILQIFIHDIPPRK